MIPHLTLQKNRDIFSWASWTKESFSNSQLHPLYAFCLDFCLLSIKRHPSCVCQLQLTYFASTCDRYECHRHDPDQTVPKNRLHFQLPTGFKARLRGSCGHMQRRWLGNHDFRATIISHFTLAVLLFFNIISVPVCSCHRVDRSHTRNGLLRGLELFKVTGQTKATGRFLPLVPNIVGIL